MNNQIYLNVKNWVYRNARHLEVVLWQYYFENGPKEAVIDALLPYQNEDGGFGNALEPDNWNPNSSPISTDTALQILRSIDFQDITHPIYKGIIKYLESGKDRIECGWKFTIESTDNYPHAQWWGFNAEYNKSEYYGVTASFSSFILRYCDKTSDLYKKAEEFAKELIDILSREQSYGDMGLSGLTILVETLKELYPTRYDYPSLENLLRNKVEKAIEHDPQKWEFYCARPSDFIRNPQSIFYQDNKDIVNEECSYLLTTLPNNDVWPITWTWLANMQQYNDQFRVSEIWWKAIKSIEKIQFLKNFKQIK